MALDHIDITAFQLAQRFVGVKETPGAVSTPLVLAMLRLDDTWPETDEVPWCSAFLNWIAWMLRLPRSKSLAAVSWLTIGHAVPLHQARTGFDVVVLKREGGHHVGFFAGRDDKDAVLLLGGNQHDSVNVSPFPEKVVLGVRSLVT